MPKSSLQLQRRRDFLRACEATVANAPLHQRPATVESIVSRTVNSTAPGYYVEFDTARKVLYTYFSRGTLPATTPHRRAMWQELAQRVDRYRERGWTLTDALTRVLSEGSASSFFMAESTACRELRSHRRSLLNKK
ncbi:MAG: hypothetical protein K2L93_06915 [Muribaculaceae bacterium]|nr:hypothetical protein [Muribaculaceae bacterium]MDE6322015.1 hypothetical protein [Muribaculaceae bacterium]